MTKRGLILVLAVFFCFAMSTTVHAFEFDIWESGMRMEEVMQRAEQMGVSLAKGGGKLGQILGLTYTDNVLGYEAQITLAFTPQKKLHMIIIVWKEEYDVTETRFDLREMYGKPECKRVKKALHEECVWWPDIYTKVLLEVRQTEVRLVYSDWSLFKFTADKKAAPPG